MSMQFYSREQLAAALKALAAEGWIENQSPNNSGGIGNTIENLLGLSVNSIPVADTAQWELKTHRKGKRGPISHFSTRNHCHAE